MVADQNYIYLDIKGGINWELKIPNKSFGTIISGQKGIM